MEKGEEDEEEEEDDEEDEDDEDVAGEGGGREGDGGAEEPQTQHEAAESIVRTPASAWRPFFASSSREPFERLARPFSTLLRSVGA